MKDVMDAVMRKIAAMTDEEFAEKIRKCQNSEIALAIRSAEASLEQEKTSCNFRAAMASRPDCTAIRPTQKLQP